MQDIAACPDPLGANKKPLHGCEPLLYLCVCSVSYVRCAYWREKQESNLQGLRSTVFKTGAVVTSASSPNLAEGRGVEPLRLAPDRFRDGDRHQSVGPSSMAEDERIARPRRSRDGLPLAVVPITSLAIPHRDPGRTRTCVRWVAATCLAPRPRDQMCGWTHRA